MSSKPAHKPVKPFSATLSCLARVLITQNHPQEARSGELPKHAHQKTRCAQNLHSLAAAVAVYGACVVLPLHAQIPTPDEFAPQELKGGVLSTVLQPDGRILIGGWFRSLAGQPRNGISRLSADGALDSDYNPEISGNLYCLAMQPDGMILAGTDTMQLGCPSCKVMSRLSRDGTLDTGFNSGADAPVYCIAVQPDGKILAGGDFRSLAGYSRKYFGRLNPDGSLDGEFSVEVDGGVYCIALQPDRKILVGGKFKMLNRQPRNYIGRLNPDGSLDVDFNPGADFHVFSMVVQPDGKIIVGGWFRTLQGQRRNYIGRLKGDGTLDTAFDPDASWIVKSIALQANGQILLGGEFVALGGLPRKSIGRLNEDGTVDGMFNAEAQRASYPSVDSLALQADGKLLVGGFFDTLGGQPHTNIGRLTSTEPATQTLSYKDSTATWLRGGSSPEVWRTTFEYSVDGVQWISLEAGTRIAGGWQLTDLFLPAGSTIRVRGYTTGGRHNASSWFVETLLEIGGVSGIPLLSVESPFGPSVRFKLTGGTNAQYSVETCTNLTPSAVNEWQPVTTLTLTNGSAIFEWTNAGETHRFFRAK